MPRKAKKVESESPKAKSTKKETHVRTRGLVSPTVVRANYDMFMSQLLEAVPSVMNARFYEMYLDAWSYCKNKYPDADDAARRQETLTAFQKLLGQVPNWKPERLADETEVMQKELPWLRKVLQQMLIARVSILMSIRDDERTRGDFEFVMPPDETIVRTFFDRAAKRLRGHAKWYDHTVDEEDREENTMLAEDLIRDSLEKSIPALVPLKNVVHEHLERPAAADEEKVVNEESDEGEYDYEYEYGAEEEDEESYSGLSASASASGSDEAVDERLPEDGSASQSDEPAPPPRATAAIVDPADVPEDPSAALETVVDGDSDKAVKLKVKARDLRELLDDLHTRRSKVPRKQKTVLAALDDEIEYREQQLKRVRHKIEK